MEKLSRVEKYKNMKKDNLLFFKVIIKKFIKFLKGDEKNENQQEGK